MYIVDLSLNNDEVPQGEISLPSSYSFITVWDDDKGYATEVFTQGGCPLRERATCVFSLSIVHLLDKGYYLLSKEKS